MWSLVPNNADYQCAWLSICLWLQYFSSLILCFTSIILMPPLLSIKICKSLLMKLWVGVLKPPIQPLFCQYDSIMIGIRHWISRPVFCQCRSWNPMFDSSITYMVVSLHCSHTSFMLQFCNSEMDEYVQEPRKPYLSRIWSLGFVDGIVSCTNLRQIKLLKSWTWEALIQTPNCTHQGEVRILT